MATFKKHLTVFESASDYEAFKSSEEFVTPNVSLCRDTNKVKFEPIEYIDEYTIVDGEMTEFVNKNPKKVGTLIYKRTLPLINVYMPLYVPFDIPLTEEFLSNYDVKQFYNVKYNENYRFSVVFGEIHDNKLKANHHYIIKVKNENAKNLTIILNDVILHKSEEKTINMENTEYSFELMGTYKKYTSLEKNQFVLGMDKDGSISWGHMDEGYSLNPFRFILTETEKSLPKLPSIDVDNLEYVEEYTIIDGQMEEFVNETSKRVGTLTYKRNFVFGYWNTLFVPFEIPMSELYENYDVACIDTVSESNSGKFNLNLKHITDETIILNASQPYVIRPKKNEYASMELVLNNTILFNSIDKIDLTCSSVYTNFTFKGSYSKIVVSETDRYYILSVDENGNQTFGYATAGSYLNPFRFYFTMGKKNIY